MTIDWGLVAGGLACIGLLACVWWTRAQRLSTAAEVREVRMDFGLRLRELEAELQSAEANMQSAEELLRDGRLSRSVRAQAMRLLRAGVSPETAAKNLGLAARETQLLARVSEMLCQP